MKRDALAGDRRVAHTIRWLARTLCLGAMVFAGGSASAAPPVADFLPVIVEGGDAPGIDGGTFCHLNHAGLDRVVRGTTLDVSRVFVDDGFGCASPLIRRFLWSGNGGLELFEVPVVATPPATELDRGTRTDPLELEVRFAPHDVSRYAFIGTLTGDAATSDDDDVLYGTGDGNVPTLVAREGVPSPDALGPPGMPGNARYTNFNPLEPHLVNSIGEIAFRHSLAVGFGGVTFDDKEALFAPDPAGDLALRVRRNVPPGTAAPFAFGFNAQGDVLLGGVDLASDPSFELSHRDGSVTLAQGTTFADPPIGLPVGTTHFPEIEPGFLNEAGEVSWVSHVQEAGVGSETALLGPDASGLVELLAITGMEAPGAPTGATFGPDVALNFRWFTINDQRDAAFVEHLEIVGTGPLGRSVWVSRAGDLELLALEGEPVVVGNPDRLPGLDASGQGAWVFDEILTDTPALSPNGATAFLATVTEGLQSTRFKAIFWHGPGEGLWLVVRQGDDGLLDFSPASSDVVTDLALHEAFYPESAIGTIGLPFQARSSDGSGVFLAVPEPAALVQALAGLAVLAGVGMVRRRLPSPP